MKKYFEILKNLWNNPRSHALIVLCLYILFFVIIFSLVDFNGTNKTPDNVLSINDNFYTLKEYNYKISIKKNEELIGLSGTKGSNEQFKIGDDIYTIIDNEIFDIKSNKYNLYDIEWVSLSPSSLKLFESKGILNATTKYKNGIVKEEYELECSKFNLKYTGTCEMGLSKSETNVEKIELKFNINEDKYYIIIEYTI